MLEQNTSIGIFDSHTRAEEAINELRRSGFGIHKLSIVGKDHHTEEHVVGYYNAGSRMKYWGEQGAFWGGVWAHLDGSALFVIPGFGPLVVAGPLVGRIVGALEGAAVGGGISVLAAGLVNMGIPRDSVLQYETAIKTGKCVLIYHGTPDEVENSRRILESAKATETASYIAEAPAMV